MVVEENHLGIHRALNIISVISSLLRTPHNFNVPTTGLQCTRIACSALVARNHKENSWRKVNACEVPMQGTWVVVEPPPEKAQWAVKIYLAKELAATIGIFCSLGT